MSADDLARIDAERELEGEPLERAEEIVDAGARLRTSGYSLMLLPNGFGVELVQSRRRRWWRWW